jgi:hypothetical protein
MCGDNFKKQSPKTMRDKSETKKWRNCFKTVKNCTKTGEKTVGKHLFSLKNCEILLKRR